MKKQILSVGDAMSRADQKQVFGGFSRVGGGVELCDGVAGSACETDDDCCESGSTCQTYSVYLDGHGHYNTMGLGTPVGTRQYCS